MVFESFDVYIHNSYGTETKGSLGFVHAEAGMGEKAFAFSQNANPMLQCIPLTPKKYHGAYAKQLDNPQP